MVEILSSISKIAIIAFFISLVAILFELFLINRQARKNKTIQIPEFDSSINATPLKAELFNTIEKESFVYKGNQTQTKILLIFVSILILSFAFIIVFILVNRYIPKKDTIEVTQPTSNIIESKGIEVFNENWQVIPQSSYGKLKVGDIIYLGVYTIKDAQINKARIRVNELNWLSDHETSDYNPEWGVYFRQYLIGSFDNQLVVEAELYSQEEGWLTL